MSLDAPWYVRNTTIHKYMQLPFVTETLRNSFSRLHSTLTDHPKPFIRHIPQNMPPLGHLRRLKRKRHTDILTLHETFKGDCHKITAPTHVTCPILRVFVQNYNVL
jgi:hypothetical protein